MRNGSNDAIRYDSSVGKHFSSVLSHIFTARTHISHTENQTSFSCFCYCAPRCYFTYSLSLSHILISISICARSNVCSICAAHVFLGYFFLLAWSESTRHAAYFFLFFITFSSWLLLLLVFGVIFALAQTLVFFSRFAHLLSLLLWHSHSLF